VTDRGFLARDPLALLFLAAATGLTAFLGIRLGSPILLPILMTFPVAILFLDRIRRERLAAALWLSLAWALFSSVAIILLTQVDPTGTERAILRGAPYREEMFAWIRTGIGAEGDPRRFLPEHALHYGVFLVVSALTFGMAGLLLGSVLLNYMSFYVGSLFLADGSGANSLTLSLMGWPVWSIARVVGFVAGGVAMAWLSRTIFERLRDRPAIWPGRAAHYLSLSLALVILDALLKALLAPHWRETLARVIGP
jgi:hypothetical protein